MRKNANTAKTKTKTLLMLMPSAAAVINCLSSLDFAVFTDSRNGQAWYNLNIVSIRKNTPIANKEYDDTLMVFHPYFDGFATYYYPITTEPSLHYIENPINSKGTFLIDAPQQCLGVYTLDTHAQNKSYAHKALCQRKGKVWGRRLQSVSDLERLSELDLVEGTGINIHKAGQGKYYRGKQNRFSAGCPIFGDGRQYGVHMAVVKIAAKEWGNSFTHTIINETDLLPFL